MTIKSRINKRLLRKILFSFHGTLLFLIVKGITKKSSNRMKIRISLITILFSSVKGNYNNLWLVGWRLHKNKVWEEDRQPPIKSYYYLSLGRGYSLLKYILYPLLREWELGTCFFILFTVPSSHSRRRKS